jgi:hypothetical protein
MNDDSPKKATKKNYVAPKLTEYGDLERITRGGCPGTSDADTTSALGSGKGGNCGS